MRGTVEIYQDYGADNQKMVYQEGNLLVDGAGSLIVDMLTTSPSLSALPSASSLLDTSNYTIQAMSFGKAESGYQKNAHTYLGSKKNLLAYSEEFDNTDAGGWGHGGGVYLQVSADQIPGPYGGTSAAELFLDTSPEYPTPQGNTAVHQRFEIPVSGAAYTGSIFVKSTAGTLNDQELILAVKYKGDAGANVADTQATFKWVDNRLVFGEASKGGGGDHQNRAHVEELSDGWWRIGMTRNWPIDLTVTKISFELFPAGWLATELSPNPNNTGSVYAWGAQLELGDHITSYQKSEGPRFVANQNSIFSTSSVGEDIIRTVERYGASSYIPEDSLPSYPSPLDNRLEKDTRTAAEIETGLDNSVGHNLNVVPYRDQILSNFISVSSYDTDEGLGITGPYVSSLGYFMGCYPEGSGTGGSPWVLVRSFDGSFVTSPSAHAITNAAATEVSATIVSGVYNSVFNDASSMDTSGFVGKVFDPNQAIAPLGSNSLSGIVVSSDNTFSGAGGAVAYMVTIGSGDVGYSNFYGGIYNMGLWVIDNKATLAEGNTPPYSFSPLNNPRKYKLFSKKTLNENLCKITDSGIAPYLYGSGQHKDLTIIWRLNF